MTKLIVVTILVNLMMFSGCHSSQNVAGENLQVIEVTLNGKVLDLNDEKKKELADLCIFLIKSSDDYYELLITDNLLQSIRDNEQYLEIGFPEPGNWTTEKFGEMKIGKILIPLSGKFASGEQLTFFSGEKDFSNTPLINSSDQSKLKALIDQFN